jgi:type IV secretory pathway VirB4 component
LALLVQGKASRFPLLQAAQKYDPLTFIFDLGGSYESLTRVFGGTYLNVGLKNPGFTINPFLLEPTPENLNFLYLFLRVLIESGGRYELTPDDEKALFAAIERVYKLPAEIRTLTNFVSILGPLGERLHKWTQAGQFGHLFDNATDTLTFSRFPDLQLRWMVGLSRHSGAVALLCLAACIVGN